MKPVQKSPRKLSLREIIRRQVDNDPQTILDREFMRVRWGVEYQSPWKIRRHESHSDDPVS